MGERVGTHDDPQVENEREAPARDEHVLLNFGNQKRFSEASAAALEGASSSLHAFDVGAARDPNVPLAPQIHAMVDRAVGSLALPVGSAPRVILPEDTEAATLTLAELQGRGLRPIVVDSNGQDTRGSENAFATNAPASSMPTPSNADVLVPGTIKLSPLRPGPPHTDTRAETARHREAERSPMHRATPTRARGVTTSIREMWESTSTRLVGAFALSLAANVLSSGLNTLTRATTIAMGLLLVAVTSFAVQRRTDRTQHRRVLRRTAALTHHRRTALLTLVGLRSGEPHSPSMYALSAVQPEYLATVGSPESAEQEARVQARHRELMSQSGDHRATQKGETWRNLEDVEDGRERIGRLLDWLIDVEGLAPEEIYVEVTGGTGLMTAAAVLAARDRGVDCLYVHSTYERNAPKAGSQRLVAIPAVAATPRHGSLHHRHQQ